MEYFKETFYKNKQPRTIIPLTRRTMPFAANEMQKAIAKMNSNKSSSCDEIPVQPVKYAQDRIHEQIAKIYNNMAETGDIPNKVTYGALKPLQKPNKTKGSPSNLRPIILLSSIRKILAACITNRIKDRLKAEIPPSQAAYRPKRSTTEHVFTSKLIIEKTITARNESAHLIMLDMSKAFDSINRNQLTEDLRDTNETNELHIISTLVNVSLSIRCENTVSEAFETNTGTPQGNCASALQFTYYLAKTLEPAGSNQLADHPYAERNIRSSIPDHITEHNYCAITQKDQIDIDMEYADDISKVTSNHSSMENFKHNTSEILKPRDLNVNHDKTEQNINRTNNEWRLCKYLRSMLDTGNGIKRRKILAITAANQLKIILDNKKLTSETKMKAFRAYVEPIFLYNCKIWTIAPSQTMKSINAFQQRLLRTYVLNVKWWNIVKNEDATEKPQLQNGATSFENED